MRAKHIKYLLTALVIVFSASCAPKRPIIFRDPSFKDYKVVKNRCGFLLWDSININSMVQDFIIAFDGDPASGESFIREHMVDCLTGRQKIPTTSGNQFSEYFKLAFSSLDSVHTDLTLFQDKYGIAALTVVNHESLLSALAAAQIEYLIVIYGLTVKKGAAAYAGPVVGVQDFPVRGMTLVPGGGDVEFATMSAQVLVLRTASMSVVWNGFVSGKGGIIYNRDTAKVVTEAFIRDLRRALR